jgi:hypothetical protein
MDNFKKTIRYYTLEEKLYVTFSENSENSTWKWLSVKIVYNFYSLLDDITTSELCDRIGTQHVITTLTPDPA